jgi:GR25 family glycosyltransferase involved in LPS biosynthesis
MDIKNHNINLSNDFNASDYKLLNNDLSNMNDEELINHYITQGIYENRLYKINLPNDFNVHDYKLLNNDLSNMNDEELINHYIISGIYENRLYKINLPNDFNIHDYKLLNNDLAHMNENELINHYINYGYFENRIYKIDVLENLININISFIIYTVKNCADKIIEYIKNIFNHYNIKYIIVYDLTQNDINLNNTKSYEYFIIFFYNRLNIILPKNKYILFQLEQLEKPYWCANNNYLETIMNSLFTLDYSYQNIRYLLSLNKTYKSKIYYQPIIFDYNLNIINCDNINYDNINYDILFYGSYNERRNNICNYLKKIYNIKIVNNIYGEELYELINNSKIILNIHFYKDAILETCRLNEILVYNKVIISELPNENDYENMELYRNNIIFIDEIKDDLSNISYLCNNIDYFLNNKNYINYLNKNYNNINYISKYTDTIFKKNLAVFYNIINNSLKINYIDSILWINLDRSIDRFNYMNNLLSNIKINNYKVSAIDGKNITNLENILNINFERKMSNYEIACTLSHIKSINYLKYLSGNYFMICEDDISFDNLTYFNYDLKKIILDAPEFDILLLYKSSIQSYSNIYIKWNKNIYGTVCYIISRNGINKLIEYAYYDSVKNNFIFNKIINFDVADIYIYKNLNTYVYKYNFITTTCEDSTIHPEHLDSHINNNITNLNLILNDFNI